MAIRFRKSIKIAPGVRWNLTGSGSSFTLGPRGASVSIGKRGTYLNTGIPGTGLYSRTRLFAGAPSRSQPSGQVAKPTYISASCGVNGDGSLYFNDEHGVPLPEAAVELAKKQNREAISDFLAQRCKELNDSIEALGKLHLGTPSPLRKPVFEETPYAEPEPLEPKQRPLGVLERLSQKRRRRVEEANRTALDEYRHAYEHWRRKKEGHEARMRSRRQMLESLIYVDVGAMEQWLQERLEAIAWPRETLVAFEVKDGGARVMMDVDLPEVEDMPTKVASTPARGLRLSIRELPPSRVQQLYAEHIHGILFRLVGEGFSALPKAQVVVAAGYSQRRDRSTGHLRDEYLLSVRVKRDEWEGLAFRNLADVDVVAALARFDLRRDMQRTGQLRALQPHTG